MMRRLFTLVISKEYPLKSSSANLVSNKVGTWILSYQDQIQLVSYQSHYLFYSGGFIKL
jgi:hypothetical protein